MLYEDWLRGGVRKCLGEKASSPERGGSQMFLHEQRGGHPVQVYHWESVDHWNGLRAEENPPMLTHTCLRGEGIQANSPSLNTILYKARVQL